MEPVALAHDDLGAGPCVVLVHGHPFGRRLWEPQRAALAPEFRLVVPDLRGYGDSPATAGVVPMRTLATDIEALLDRLEIASAAVVGLSMGGLIAMELAIATPARWWALGLIATTAEPVDDEERRARLALADRVEAEGGHLLAEQMRAGLFDHGVAAEVERNVEAMMAAASPAGAAAAIRGRAQRPDYRPGLGRLDVPVLVCAGTADPWSTQAVTDRLVASLRDPEVLILDGVGHLPNMESPERFNRELLGFLRRTRPVS